MLSDTQRQAGDAELRERWMLRDSPAWGPEVAWATLSVMERYDPDYLYENKVIADHLKHALDALSVATNRSRDLENGQRDLLRVLDDQTKEIHALRAEVAAHAEAWGEVRTALRLLWESSGPTGNTDK